MQLKLTLVLTAAITVAWILLPSQSAADEKPVPPARTFERTIKPFIGKFCTKCHGARRKRAGLNLEEFRDAKSVVTQRQKWERILDMLREREMPPEDKMQPSEIERAGVVEWIQDELAKFDCKDAVDPGRPTLHRLNRTEYNNTVRDLLGVDFRPADQFPVDEVGHGFDNNGDVLSLPPLLAEKYLDAAEQIVEKAVAKEKAARKRRRIQAESRPIGEHMQRLNWAVSVNREGALSAPLKVQAAGAYVLRARAYGQQAGPDPTRLAFLIDEKEVARVDVTAEDDAPRVYEVPAKLSAGTHRFAVAYVNNYNEPNHPNPALRGDRNLIIDWFEAEPVTTAAAGGATVFICEPPAPGEETDCARRILKRFASRAYRRPILPDELARLLGLVAAARDAGDDFEAAVLLAVKAILVSPHFLFRVEVDPQPNDPTAIHALNDYELASRLSYFLWSTMPDAELFDLAAAGKLQDTAVLRTQVARMLKSDRSGALIENFVGQWLQTRLLERAAPDPELFPEFNDKLREDMRRETHLFAATILRENRSILEFIDADFTFLNERLARHYGLTDDALKHIKGETFQRVKLEDSQRGGVLTHASFLTITSNPRRTSPVKRGLWILERILGTPPPPPPPEVEALPEDEEAITSGSLRQRLEKHRADPNCGICHNRMDPLGFAFENFDPVGRWREFDGNFLVDASGELPNGRKFEGAAGLKVILKGQSEEFARSVAEKLLTYALGRGLKYYDKCAVDEIVDEVRSGGYKFSSLVTAVVLTDAFRMRRGGVTNTN